MIKDQIFLSRMDPTVLYGLKFPPSNYLSTCPGFKFEPDRTPTLFRHPFVYFHRTVDLPARINQQRK